MTLMRKRAVRWSILAISLLLVGAVGVFLFYTPSSCFPPVPQPNGYEALTRASSKLVRPLDSVKALSTEKLAEALDGNRAALEEVRHALQVPGVVSVQMSESWFTVHTPQLMNLKAAAFVLDGEADLRSRRGDTNGALLSALDCLRLGEAIQRGGVFIDFLVGSACELIAVHRMTNLVTSLGPEDCKKAMLALQEHEARKDSLEGIQRREKEWSRRTFSIWKRVGAAIRPKAGTEFVTSDVVKDYNSRTRQLRLVLLSIAARVYELERGTAPAKAADLVPAYLQQLPLDPATGKPLELK